MTPTERHARNLARLAEMEAEDAHDVIRALIAALRKARCYKGEQE